MQTEIKNLRRKSLLKIDVVGEYDELQKLEPASYVHISTNVHCSTQIKKYEILLKSTSKKARYGRKPSHAIVPLKGRKKEILGFGFCINQWSRECGARVLKKLNWPVFDISAVTQCAPNCLDSVYRKICFVLTQAIRRMFFSVDSW